MNNPFWPNHKTAFECLVNMQIFESKSTTKTVPKGKLTVQAERAINPFSVIVRPFKIVLVTYEID